MGTKVFMTVDRCPNGHGFEAIGLDNGAKTTGEYIGFRLTDSKCCGSWTTVKSWKVDAERVIEKLQTLIKEAK